MADIGQVNPCISEPTVITSSQTPSALELGDVRFSENVEHSNAHPSPIPFTTRIIFTTTGARSSAITEPLAAHLHHPVGLDMGMQHVSLFNLREDGDHNADAKKNCSCFGAPFEQLPRRMFVPVGIALVVIGVVACLWNLLDATYL
jgi:hypothetical protein